MKTAAIICEYNPFHNGHEYHIMQTRNITSADCVIAIMSGNYVQRGTPAVMDKKIRTQAASWRCRSRDRTPLICSMFICP